MFTTYNTLVFSISAPLLLKIELSFTFLHIVSATLYIYLIWTNIRGVMMVLGGYLAYNSRDGWLHTYLTRRAANSIHRFGSRADARNQQEEVKASSSKKGEIL